MIYEDILKAIIKCSTAKPNEKFYKHLFWFYCSTINIDLEHGGSRRGAGAKGCEYKATIVGYISTRRSKLLFINIVMSLIWRQRKNPALSSATRYLNASKIRILEVEPYES